MRTSYEIFLWWTLQSLTNGNPILVHLMGERQHPTTWTNIDLNLCRCVTFTFAIAMGVTKYINFTKYVNATFQSHMKRFHYVMLYCVHDYPCSCVNSGMICDIEVYFYHHCLNMDRNHHKLSGLSHGTNTL